MLRHFPGEAHRVHLFRRRGALRHGAQFALLDFTQIRLLHQHSAVNALQLQFAFRLQAAGGQFEQAQIFLRRENGFGFFIETRRGDALHEKFRDLFRRRRIHDAVERQHAAERRNRIARQRFQIRLAQRSLLRRPARIVVLDDHRRRIGKFPGQAARRFEVHEIVVRKLFPL